MTPPPTPPSTPSAPPVRVVGHDHVVLNVADPERSLAWYRDKLGLAPEREDEWRRGETLFVSLRVNEATVIDLLDAAFSDAHGTDANVDHFSLRVADDVDLEAVAASGEFDVVSGPSWIWGAAGYGTGLYVRDPDGNTVELKHYPPGDASRAADPAESE